MGDSELQADTSTGQLARVQDQSLGVMLNVVDGGLHVSARCEQSIRIMTREVAPGYALSSSEHRDECVLSVNARDKSRKCFRPDIEPFEREFGASWGSKVVTFGGSLMLDLLHSVS